ncbi:MAG: hypothetical protein P4M07_05440 [Xanthobacteraceae bacterium]|nr:hypothetical protein [Xanthobacteraceae bacterium]
MPARPPGGEDVNPTYSFKPSLMAPAWRFELTDQGLSWRMGGRAGLWPYAGIARIRLSYRPTAMQARRYRADIRNGDGRTITVFSASWQAATLLAPQDDPYRRFMLELHRRIAGAAGRPELIGGLSRPLHAAALVASGFVYAALAGLLVRAVAVASIGGMLFLVGFAALFGWKVGGALHRNRPRAYRLDDPPGDLLP